MEPLNKLRLCIIGGGGAGLGTLKNALSFADNIQPILFEQRNCLGGLWNFCDDPTDELHYSPLYEGLITNLPKEIMFYMDFKWDKYKVPPKQSYPDHQAVLSYLNDYAEEFKLKEFIKFNSIVKRVAKIGDGREPKWCVSVQNSVTKTVEDFIFDAVVVCSGHYKKPKIPPIYEDVKRIFKGQILFGLDYKRPEVFQGQRVLIIGGGPSGMDIAIGISKYAKEVFLSLKNKRAFTYGNLESIPNLQQVSTVVSVQEDAFTLEDDLEINCDTVIFCTGYVYDYPFLEEGLVDLKYGGMHVTPLYRHIIHRKWNTLAFIGVPYIVCPFILFDVQSRYFLEYLRGRMSLPSEEEMIKDYEDDQEIRRKFNVDRDKSHLMHLEGLPFFDYLASLAKLAGFEEEYYRVLYPHTPTILVDILYKIGTDVLTYKDQYVEIIEKEGEETSYKYHT